MLEYLDMSKHDVNEYNKSYHPPETIRIEYCASVLAVVLENHPRAKELYEDIMIGTSHA